MVGIAMFGSLELMGFLIGTCSCRFRSMFNHLQCNKRYRNTFIQRIEHLSHDERALRERAHRSGTPFVTFEPEGPVWLGVERTMPRVWLGRNTYKTTQMFLVYLVYSLFVGS